jgi:phage shock protein B
VEAIVPLVAILMVFGTPVAIVWIHHHYKHKRMHEESVRRNIAGASSAELLTLADKMEKRIEALEQILDAESPGWRQKYHERS